MSPTTPKRPTAGNRDVRWNRGYYCAVAQALKEEGCASTLIRSLFLAGGDPNLADPSDVELFIEHGLMPGPTTPAKSAAEAIKNG